MVYIPQGISHAQPTQVPFKEPAEAFSVVGQLSYCREDRASGQGSGNGDQLLRAGHLRPNVSSLGYKKDGWNRALPILAGQEPTVSIGGGGGEGGRR